MIVLSFIMLSMLFVGVTAHSARYDHWYRSENVTVTDDNCWYSNIMNFPYGCESPVGWRVFQNNYPVAENISAGHFGLDVVVYFDDLSMFRPYNTEQAIIQIGMTDTYFAPYMILNMTGNSGEVDIAFSFDGVTPATPEDVWSHNREGVRFAFRYESIRSPMKSTTGSYTIEQTYRIEIQLLSGEVQHVLMDYRICSEAKAELTKPAYFYKEYIDLGNWVYEGHYHVLAWMYEGKFGCHSDTKNSDAICNIVDVSFEAIKNGLMEQGRINDWWWTTDDWNADVNADGKIDIKDIAYISQHFGLPP